MKKLSAFSIGALLALVAITASFAPAPPVDAALINIAGGHGAAPTTPPDPEPPSDEITTACTTSGYTNVYIRQGAGGAGTSWADALSTWPGTATRARNYWVADGSYSGKTFSTAASGTNAINICKATADDHGSDVGWDPTYGDGVATITSGIAFSTSYHTFDGATGGGPGSWTTGYGFKLNVTSGPAIRAPANNPGTTLSNITVKHVEIEGAGDDGGGSSNDGVALFPNRLTAGLFEFMYIHDMGRTIYFLTGQNDVTFRYQYTGQHESTASEHSELASIWADSGNLTFEHSIFTHAEVGAFLWDNHSNHNWRFTVCGSVFVDLPGSLGFSGGNGVITGWTGGSGSDQENMWNIRSYHNTFISTGGAGSALGTISTNSGNNEDYNSLFYNVTDVGGGSDWAVVSSNHFVGSSSTGTSASTSSGDPFVDWDALDFRLTSNTPAGADIGLACATDMYGNPRTTRTRGAVEYQAGGAALQDLKDNIVGPLLSRESANDDEYELPRLVANSRHIGGVADTRRRVRAPAMRLLPVRAPR